MGARRWLHAMGTMATAGRLAGLVTAAPASAAKPMATAASTTTTDTGALEAIAEVTGARDLWACGYAGEGVDVALVDTGVAPGARVVNIKVGAAADARNPDVVAVSAADLRGSTKPLDWSVADVVDRGTPDRAVDVQGLRVPGSVIDSLAPSATGDPFERGSGTSQAAAVVAGLAAQLAQRSPGATPAQIKGMLQRGAVPLASGRSRSQGPGHHGHGPIQSDRADATLALDRVELTGEIDVQGNAWSSTAWAAAAAAGTSWQGGAWMGHTWTGNKFGTNGWKTATWADSWSGKPFSASGGPGGTWDGLRWNGLRWNLLRLR